MTMRDGNEPKKEPESEAWKTLILDHYKNPRHYGELENPSASSEQHNRTCGDHVKVFAKFSEHGHFQFIGAGCSLCLASASLMLELIQDKTRPEVEAISNEFQNVWDKGLSEKDEGQEAWKALEGLKAYPVRSRCVKLAWQALEELLSVWKKASDQ